MVITDFLYNSPLADGEIIKDSKDRSTIMEGSIGNHKNHYGFRKVKVRGVQYEYSMDVLWYHGIKCQETGLEQIFSPSPTGSLTRQKMKIKLFYMARTTNHEKSEKTKLLKNRNCINPRDLT